MVDINGDGQMDTIDPSVRVLITDVQWTGAQSGNLSLRDSIGGKRWTLSSGLGATVAHLGTPLVLSVGSDLFLDVPKELFPGTGGAVDVNIIGRVVNL